MVERSEISRIIIVTDTHPVIPNECEESHKVRTPQTKKSLIYEIPRRILWILCRNDRLGQNPSNEGTPKTSGTPTNHPKRH